MNLRRHARPPSAIGGYTLGEELGRGGMGAVYAAEHTVLKRRVAIKLLLSEHAGEAEMRTRFLREARAVAKLQHANLVPVIDFGELDDGTLYFVSELVGGESLRTRLKRDGALPVNRAIAFAAQVARGLACAHQAGIVHRDLKPSNVMLVGEPEAPFGERVKILDFGVAKVTGSEGDDSELTTTGALVGTPGFMSPEQCRGVGEVDHRSDIYSLGVVLYLMLAGRPTFVGNGLGEVLAMHIYVAPSPLSTLLLDVPPQLDAIVLRCLAKSPAERYPSMHALVADLEAVLPTMPTTTLRPLGEAAVGAPGQDDPYDRSLQQTIETIEDKPRRAGATDVDAAVPLPSDTVPAIQLSEHRARRQRHLIVGLSLAIVACLVAIWIATGDDLDLGAAGDAPPAFAPAAVAPPSTAAPAVVPPAPAPAAATHAPAPPSDAPGRRRASEPPAAGGEAFVEVDAPGTGIDPAAASGSDPAAESGSEPETEAGSDPAAAPEPEPARADRPRRTAPARATRPRRARPARDAPPPARTEPKPAAPARETFERPVF